MTTGKSIFLTGVAGSGKSHILKLFVRRYKGVRNIAVTSTTGTSALLIEGVTLHSYLGIGLGRDDVDTLADKIMKNNWYRNRWEGLQCLVIDEVSMLTPKLFDKLEQLARVIRRNTMPFGGVQLILTGDFLQLPCIDSNDFCFNTDAWRECIDHVVYLKKVYRQKDKAFQDCLNSVRLGEITPDVKRLLDSRVGSEIVNDDGIKPTKLYALNRDVDDLNEQELDTLAADGRTFFEYDMRVYNNARTSSAVTKLIKNCPAAKTIQLCVGAQVMLLKNIDQGVGLVNGSRGIVQSFEMQDDGVRYPLVKFVCGETRVIGYQSWQEKKANSETIVAEVCQLPLKVAYAITIHKAQGVSLDCVELDLSNVFEYNQAYVALSRVKNINSLSITREINYDKIQAHPSALEFYMSI